MDVARVLPRRLALWGAVSVVAGLAAGRYGRDDEQRAFGRQTVGWGAVDLAIAAFGIAGSGRPAPSTRRLRRILLVNSLADVGYVAAGAHLAVRRGAPPGRLTPATARGHGAAVVVQGLALLALDAWHLRRLPPG